MSTKSWYKKLKKPPFAPPDWVFGPVWTTLYIIIVITYGFIMMKYIKGELPLWLILLFAVNLVSNVVYSPIQFGLRNNEAALVDVAILDLTLIAAMAGIFQFYPWITYALIPYLAWVYAASVLQISVTYLNRTKR